MFQVATGRCFRRQKYGGGAGIAHGADFAAWEATGEGETGGLGSLPEMARRCLVAAGIRAWLFAKSDHNPPVAFGSPFAFGSVQARHLVVGATGE